MNSCIKCKGAQATVDIRFAVYCEYNLLLVLIYSECFQEQVYHKYRMTVAKACSDHNDLAGPSKILLALSSGSASRLLLHFSQMARLKTPQRPNLDEIHVAHILEPHETEEETRDFCDPYKEHLASYSVVPLSRVLGRKNEAQKLNVLLQSCRTENSRECLLRILRFALLVKLADDLGCRLLYLGDTCSRMAVNIMVDTCEGRGMQLPWRFAQLQQIIPFSKFTFLLILPLEVRIVRPLREIVDSEVKHYLQLKDPNWRHSNITLDESDPNTIYAATDSTKFPDFIFVGFVAELDAENSATVSTVTRTTAKIQTVISDLREWQPCALCLAPIDTTDKGLICHGCRTIIDDMDIGEDLLSALPSYTEAIFRK